MNDSVSSYFNRKMAEIGRWGPAILCVFIILSTFSDVESWALNPVILVPGDGGSEFEAKLNKTSVPHVYCEKFTKDYFSLWLDLEELNPLTIDCFVENMRLVYDNKTHTTRNSPGTDIRIPGFGDTETVEFLDPSHFPYTTYFNPIVEAMVKIGYKRGVNVRGAPFDFRKAPNEFGEFYAALQKLIEQTYSMNNNTKVIILGHSMGNPTMLYFYNHMPQDWKDKYIKSHISLAGVWAGAVKPLRLFASGDNLNLIIVKPITVRRLQRSYPSSAWFMPSDQLWGPKDILVVSPTRNYTVNDYKQFFEDIDFPLGWTMLQDTAPLIHSMTPPGVEVYCVHGAGLDTPGTLVYSKDQWFDSQPSVIPDDGDGTVNMRSLLQCLEWQGKQKQDIYHRVFKDVEHLGILQDKGVINYIIDVLQGKIGSKTRNGPEINIV